MDIATVIHDEDQTNKILNDGWIPGNEPMKEGPYEVTFENHSVDFAHYFDLTFYHTTEHNCAWDEKFIIAYKPIKVSKGYRPPELGRKLLCAYCDKEAEVRKYNYGYHFIYSCGSINCSFLFPLDECTSMETARAKAFEIYDKLNPEKVEKK